MKASVLLLALGAAATPALAQRPVSYTLGFPNAAHHEAEVAVVFPDVPAGRPLEVRMSRTSEGRHGLHEFAKNVYNVRAADGAGRPLRITRPSPYQWNVEGHDGTVRVTYTLFGDRADGMYAAIDDTHAHLNAPATYMWARGLERRPVSVAFRVPRPEWKAATQLAPAGAPYTFTAPDLRSLMDSPVELSAHEVRSWTVASGGRPQTIRLAMHHTGTPAELDAFTETVKRVVDEHVAVFGGLPPLEGGAYTFIADYLPYLSEDENDGMEHRNSAVLVSPLPLARGADWNIAPLSHEFFHLWNAKRIRPRSLEPFSFEEVTPTPDLWFYEGFTAYYGHLLLARAGAIDPMRYMMLTGAQLNEVLGSPSRRYFSPVEKSLQAPFVDVPAIDRDNRANTFLTYYSEGSLLALGLDLTLRTRYGRTLDDYMRAVWRAHGEREAPYTREDLRDVLAGVTGDRAFAGDFFRRYVEGREVMDYAPLLAAAGYRLAPFRPGRAYLGEPGPFIGTMEFEYADGKVRVAAPAQVGTPLYDAGIDLGDLILSIDGKALASQEELDALVGARKPGDTVEVRFEKRGETRTARVALAEDPLLALVPFEQAGLPVTDAVRAFRRGWLGSRARPAAAR